MVWSLVLVYCSDTTFHHSFNYTKHRQALKQALFTWAMPPPEKSYYPSSLVSHPSTLSSGVMLSRMPHPTSLHCESISKSTLAAIPLWYTIFVLWTPSAVTCLIILWEGTLFCSTAPDTSHLDSYMISCGMGKWISEKAMFTEKALSSCFLRHNCFLFLPSCSFCSLSPMNGISQHSSFILFQSNTWNSIM